MKLAFYKKTDTNEIFRCHLIREEAQHDIEENCNAYNSRSTEDQAFIVELEQGSWQEYLYLQSRKNLVIAEDNKIDILNYLDDITSMIQSLEVKE